MQTRKEYKIIYSLRVHMRLRELGFNALTEMRNPQNQKLNCWVYERTPEFMAALGKVIGGQYNGI